MSSPSLKTLYNAVFKARAKWRLILLQLDVSDGTIEALGMRWKENPDDCLYHGLSKWLNGGERNWSEVMEALSCPPVGRQDLAKKIKRDHLQTVGDYAITVRQQQQNAESQSPIAPISDTRISASPVSISTPGLYGNDNSIEVDHSVHSVSVRDPSPELSPWQTETQVPHISQMVPNPHHPQHVQLMEVDHQIISEELNIFTQELLGSGSFGTVFKGLHKRSLCAVKVLNHVAMGMQAGLPVGPGQVEAVKAFDRECEFLKSFKHPNVVEHLTTARHPKSGNKILVTELMDCNLSSYLPTSAGTLTTEGEISISRDIAMGLAYIHSRNIIHRDLCGYNILLKLTNQVPLAKISDFGMSRLLDPVQMTHSLTGLGHRRAYLPPEAARLEEEDYDESLDVFSMGVVMIQIACRVDNVGPKDRDRLLRQIPASHPLRRSILACLSEDSRKRPSANVTDYFLQFKQIISKNLVTSLVQLKPPLTIESKERLELPFGFSAFLQNVAIDDAVFFTGSYGDSHRIMKYHRGQWLMLNMVNTNHMFTMTSLNDQLVLIGSIDGSSQMFFLRGGKWKHPYRPPDIVRYWATAIAFCNSIIVAGGCGIDTKLTSTVELFAQNLNTWIRLQSLPKPLHSMKSVIVGNSLYLMGGCDENGATKSVFKGNLDHLISSLSEPSSWEQIEDAPLYYSAPLAIGNSLLAVGGLDHENPSSSIHLYQPDSRNWVKVGDLPSPRSNCCCSVLPNNSIVVFGHGEDDGATKFVDVISITS